MLDIELLLVIIKFLLHSLNNSWFNVYKPFDT